MPFYKMRFLKLIEVNYWENINYNLSIRLTRNIGKKFSIRKDLCTTSTNVVLDYSVLLNAFCLLILKTDKL